MTKTKTEQAVDELMELISEKLDEIALLEEGAAELLKALSALTTSTIISIVESNAVAQYASPELRYMMQSSLALDLIEDVRYILRARLEEQEDGEGEEADNRQQEFKWGEGGPTEEVRQRLRQALQEHRQQVRRRHDTEEPDLPREVEQLIEEEALHRTDGPRPEEGQDHHGEHGGGTPEEAHRVQVEET